MARPPILLGDPAFSSPRAKLLHSLGTSEDGLTGREAQARLQRYGPNTPASKSKVTWAWRLMTAFLNPLNAILTVIAVVSYVLSQHISAFFIAAMVLVSVLLSFVQEHKSNKAAERLSALVRTTATVLRDGQEQEVDIKTLVPGDIVLLKAGDIIPADLRLLRCRELFVNESSLTGESLPVEKTIETPRNGSMGAFVSIAFMGSSVVSGSGMAVVVKTGLATQFGKISSRLAAIPQENAFEKGVRGFTGLMIRIIVVLAVIIFFINVATKGDTVQALIFALAVAVGLAPEMLPMLIVVNLSKGAIAMSRKKVIVKKLNSIQNFGAMDVLCTDKTGTLTENKIILEKYCDVRGKDDQDVLRLAYLNSSMHTGLRNLLDEAIIKHKEVSHAPCAKIDEVPFDYERRMMSVTVSCAGKHRLIAKGAPEEVFKRCTHYEQDGRIMRITPRVIGDLKKEFFTLAGQGLMVLAVAYRDFPAAKRTYGRHDEAELVLRGYVAFLDPPKASARKTLHALRQLGIEIKVLTGDNERVTEKICREVGMTVRDVLTGDAVEAMNDADLRCVVDGTTIFARLNPLQKERVINALRQKGHTVGYLGDGINDAPSLKAADVGISVNNAVDIAKESADLILLEKDLMVLRNGVIEGRKTFGNITKYIRMGASSNFGNMFSMIGGSFLPFLPMAPVHILLNNFLYDFSQVTISTDGVDEAYVKKPRQWDIAGIRRFLFFIGPLSSIFDFITFGVMWFVFHASAPLFQTGWFIQSLCTQTLIVHVIRTNKIPFIESRASWPLTLTTLGVVAIGIAIPYTPLGPLLGFARPPAMYFVYLAGIVVSYLALVFVIKRWLSRKYAID